MGRVSCVWTGTCVCRRSWCCHRSGSLPGPGVWAAAGVYGRWWGRDRPGCCLPAPQEYGEQDEQKTAASLPLSLTQNLSVIHSNWKRSEQNSGKYESAQPSWHIIKPPVNSLSTCTTHSSSHHIFSANENHNKVTFLPDMIQPLHINPFLREGCPKAPPFVFRWC